MFSWKISTRVNALVDTTKKESKNDVFHCQNKIVELYEINMADGTVHTPSGLLANHKRSRAVLSVNRPQVDPDTKTDELCRWSNDGGGGVGKKERGSTDTPDDWKRTLICHLNVVELPDRVSRLIHLFIIPFQK